MSCLCRGLQKKIQNKSWIKSFHVSATFHAFGISRVFMAIVIVRLITTVVNNL